jgi:hypothetical protein
MSRKGLVEYPGTATKLPEAAIRFVYDEWTTLSANAAAWIFPSYLRSVLTNEDEDKDYPPQTTEWLIYSLRPIAKRRLFLGFGDGSRGIWRGRAIRWNTTVTLTPIEK